MKRLDMTSSSERSDDLPGPFLRVIPEWSTNLLVSLGFVN